MHERGQLARQEHVIDEEVLFDRESRMASLQIARAVVKNAVP